MAPEMTIKIEGLSRRFEGPPPHLALDRLNLEIAPGEFLCIVGPSGCGKTTLLRILAGLDGEFSGWVSIPGNLQSATVFQEPRLMPWLTVLENLLLVAPTADEAARQRALILLEELGVANFAQAFPSQLSGGMQRRVAIARALLVSPDLIMMDEPFVSVDQPTAEYLRALVTRLWRDRETTNLFVTHDLREALALATRIVFLSRGPGRLILDWPVKLPPPAERTPIMLETARETLLAAHPRILQGGAA
jgi:ABC-type nitrate/sulfonate/bicarbonate transport system ATPase subunit